MRIKKIRLKNIRSYEEGEIEFPDGAVLLSGDIGSGKTSILLAVEYALFGLQPGQKGLALLRNNTAMGEVDLELEIDGRTILIERKLRRSGKSVSNEYAAITIDGEKTELSITELKTRILELLQYPSEFIKKNNLLYRYTVYTPQEQMKRIILEDPQTRLNVIRHIFGIDKYKIIRENLIILLNKLKEDSKFLQGEISTLDKDKRNLKSRRDYLVVLDKKIKEKETELSKSIKKRMQIESESRELESKLKEKEKFEGEVEKTNLMISTKRNTLSSINSEFSSIQKQILKAGFFDEEHYNEIIKSLEENKEKIEELRLKYFELNTKMNSLEKSQQESIEKRRRIFKIDICPTCLQNVSDTYKHNIMNETEKEIVNIKRILEELEKEMAQIASLTEKEQLKEKELEKQKFGLEKIKSEAEQANQLKIKLKELERQKKDLEKDLAFLSKHLVFLRETILEFSKYINLFKMKQEEVKGAFDEEKKAEIAVAQLSTELELTNKEIQNIEELIKQKEESKKKLSKILEISDWLSNQFLNLINFTERNILMKLRLEFSNLFNRWFNILTNDAFEAHLDENFTPLVAQRGTEMEYDFLSGGERTAIALAYRLALNQTVNSVLSKIKTREIIILDEPTDGFSEIQLEKMYEILDELNTKQLIVVSHERKIEDFVDKVIKLRKEGDISTLESQVPTSEAP